MSPPAGLARMAAVRPAGNGAHVNDPIRRADGCAPQPGAAGRAPSPELAKRLSELPKRREVVAYCRGPYCVLAIEAVNLLRARGLKAVRLEDGVLEWAAMGLELESKPAG